MKTFKLSEKQAQAILDMPLKRLTALEKLKIEEELKELKEFIAYCEDLLAHPNKILAVIKNELQKISETAELGSNVTLYQGVTLGGTGKEKGKRHPTIGNNVVVSSGAKVLGSFKVGDNSKIGSGSVVLKEVPPNSVVVGVPGRVVTRNGVRIASNNDAESMIDLNHDKLPDPVADYEELLAKHMEEINGRLKELENLIYDTQSKHYD